MITMGSRLLLRQQFRLLLLIAVLPSFSWADKVSASRCNAVEVAEALIQSTEPFDAALGAGTLLQSGRSEAFGLLLSQLNSESDLVSRAALDTLISVETLESEDVLRKIVEFDQSWGELVASSLVAIPRPGMIRVLKSIAFGKEYEENGQARAHALRALADRNQDVSTEVLSQLMLQKESELLRLTASYLALRQGFESAKAVDVFTRAIDDGTAAQQLAAVAFGYSSSDGAGGLLERLSNSDNPQVAIAATVSQAAQESQPAKDILVNLIITGTPMEAALAAAGLRRMPVNIAYDISKKVMMADQWRVEGVLRLIESWAWLDSEHVGEIASWGLDQPDVDVVLQSLWLVGWKPQPELEGRLAGFLSHHNTVVRGMAAWSLVRDQAGTQSCRNEAV